MIQKFMRNVRLAVLSLATFVFVGVGVVGPLASTAAADNFKSDACAGLSQVGGSCGASGSTKVNNLLVDIVNILSALVGFAAVVMVILSGFKYITAGGDAQKITSAKTSLIYAIVGLVIVAFAQMIVHFVLLKASKV